MPKQGGNIEKLKTVQSNQRSSDCEEFTMVQWAETAHELILF